MSLEQLAILGVAIFGLIAIVHAFNTVRGLRRIARRPRTEGRMRRLISGEGSARAVARSLLREVVAKHGPLVERARESGRLAPELEDALAEAQEYYRERVDKRLRPLFHEAVDAVILGRPRNGEEGGDDDADPFATG